MIKGQHNLYEGIPEPLQPLTRYNELIPHIGEVFANALMEIIPIYNTSDFLVKMHQLPCYYKECKQASLGRIFYEDEYLVGYLDKLKVKSAYPAYCAGYELKSPLMAYEFMVFDNKHANSIGIIHHYGVRRYDSLWMSHPIDPDVRKELYENLCAFAQRGFWIAPDALAYCPETRDFKVLDFQNVRLKQPVDPVAMGEYLTQYRRLLKI